MHGYIRQIFGDKQGGLASSLKLWSMCSPSQKTSRSIAHVRYVVVQFYARFKFYSLLFHTHYHTLPNPKAKKKNLNKG